MAVDKGNGGGGVGGTEGFAMTEPQYVPAKVSVWWDLENCHVPKGCEPHLIAKNISSALVTMNYCGPVSINAYGDTTKIAPSVQQALNSTGVSLNHVPAGAKDASDKKILVDMLFWAVDNPAPANYLLISGDRDFSNALHQLRMRRYNILLAQPTCPSIHLIAAAKNVWLWSSLVTGGPPLKNTELSHFINSSTSTVQETRNGLPNKTNNSQNFSGNPNLTVPIPGPTPFSPTFSNNGSNNHNYYENNPYRMPIRPQTFPMQPTPPPPPNFIPPLSHAHSMPLMSPRPNNTFTFTAGPLNYSPHTNNLTGTDHSDLSYRPHPHNGPAAGPNNQLPFNGLQRSNTLPNNPSPFNGPRRSHTLPIASSNQPPITWTYNDHTVPNTVGFNHQLPINGPQNGLMVPNTVGFNHQLPINGPQNGLIVPNTVGFNHRLPINGPQNGRMVPNGGGFNNQSTVNKPQKGKTVPNTTGSDFQSTIKSPLIGNVPTSNGLLVSSGCPLVPNVIVLALGTLKNEKIMPTKENIADCIKYGDPKYRNTYFKKALKNALKQELVVNLNVGVSELYVCKDEMLWKCVNIISGNIKQYSEIVWGEIEKFLSSASGRDAILATECRYEAATIMKKECLKDLSLGKILQILHMVIEYKKWIIPNESGWQPLEITFTENNPLPGVASTDVYSN